MERSASPIAGSTATRHRHLLRSRQARGAGLSSTARRTGCLTCAARARLREVHLGGPSASTSRPIRSTISSSRARRRRSPCATLAEHTHFFTYGENLGHPDCPVPLRGYPWRETRPPVVLDLWPPRAPGGRFTRSRPGRTRARTSSFRGARLYHWSKHLNFLRFPDLPGRATQPLELAVDPPTGEHGGGAAAPGGAVSRWSVARPRRDQAHITARAVSSPSPRTSRASPLGAGPATGASAISPPAVR